jgi:hypothetical protein
MTEEERKVKGEAFMKAYSELVAEHQIDFATYPVFIPDGAGGFKIIVQSTPVDISKRPEPLIAKEK